MTSTKELWDRRKQVLRLAMQGLNNDTIAKQLDTPLRSIERDLAAVRSEIASKYQDSIGWERIVDYNEGQRLRVQRLWAIVADQKSPTREVIRAIRELRAEEEQAIKKDQIAGILPRTNEDVMQPIVTGDNSKVQVNHVNVYQTLLQITEAEKQVIENNGSSKKENKASSKGKKK